MKPPHQIQLQCLRKNGLVLCTLAVVASFLSGGCGKTDPPEGRKGAGCCWKTLERGAAGADYNRYRGAEGCASLP